MLHVYIGINVLTRMVSIATTVFTNTAVRNIGYLCVCFF